LISKGGVVKKMKTHNKIKTTRHVYTKLNIYKLADRDRLVAHKSELKIPRLSAFLTSIGKSFHNLTPLKLILFFKYSVLGKGRFSFMSELRKL
jgi:hypothetical protein